ncbi:PREDICTED: zinc transporter ZIP4-like [Amphimedon queenslandica]|uniref:Zinc transporter ZIP4 N-terminal domain-containing protein n=1 Tax=Amphimedon queenslandica TaxID=400682 RepID=A0A1X7UHY4_AMPQE|nr:PREDICTED: zinc transporter ZIP4-like [Amphimedon queenslandica]|eukprot:XP_019854074.1 PREDICTED: zinc transporter ZIP4-like [Amphimedon queenslandica]
MRLLLLVAVFSLFACVLSQTINSCPTESALIGRFNEASRSLEVRGCDGQICNMEDHHDDDHDDHDDDHDDHDDDHHRKRRDSHDHGDEDHHDEMNCTTCGTAYNLTRMVILSLGLTTVDCLEGHNHNTDPPKPSTSEAYGYGFLMITFVCLCSLMGIFLVPLINSNSKIGRQTYEYVYAFMIAIGISALISDAVLHLIPHSFGLHAHEEEGGAHDHEAEEENKDFIWKGCLVLLGAYLFYLLEVALHGLGDYLKKSSPDRNSSSSCANGDGHSIPEMKELKTDKLSSSDEQESELVNDEEKPKSKLSFLKRIEPVAWLIIVGDALHNFADGIALGAAIVQSLTLGVSTMFALIFHEVPHELGDYVILIKSGFHWGTALLVNFFSSLTAILGFFIGAAISSNSDEANGYILAITAGLFFYIALTDLLPELIHGAKYVKFTKTGWRWGLRFFLTNLGFFIAFAVLLVLAVYEEDLNELIE